MTSATLNVDSSLLRESFREWHAEHDALDAQLAESMTALTAYQSHLDDWQQELVHERARLEELRTALEHDEAASAQQVEELTAALDDARQKIATLTTALLDRTEEIRQVEQLRSQAQNELIQARAREKELAAALASAPSQQSGPRSTAEADGPPQPEAARSEPARDVPPLADEARRATSPVLGSVLEQFGKLRQQRTQDRQHQP